jgi:cyanophycin synthetase
MKILKVQALRGPNIWSINRKKLIQMRLAKSTVYVNLMV